ncbi:hypothetical protein HZH68_014017 [Vespula germanica]|uniref:Uncharacterized protein n=1 Tax=Vespula germanica TaxID=30212 RepID=A0A834JED0_VESGE|nr:hypothetical protein HZH68_014017 [Vespula germanica]
MLNDDNGDDDDGDDDGDDEDDDDNADNDRVRERKRENTNLLRRIRKVQGTNERSEERAHGRQCRRCRKRVTIIFLDNDNDAAADDDDDDDDDADGHRRTSTTGVTLKVESKYNRSIINSPGLARKDVLGDNGRGSYAKQFCV